MKVVAIILLVLVVIVGGFWIYGLTLPVSYHNTASTELPITPLQTWFKLHDHTEIGNWHPDIDSVAWVNHKFGLGAEYIDYFRTGESMRLRITEYEPFTRYTSTIADSSLPFIGSWTYELEQIPTGTRLTITENSEIPGGMMRALYALMKPETTAVQRYADNFAK